MKSKWEQELEEQRSNRRQQIIVAAQELFLDKDLHGVTMKDIGHQLGISRVTLYKYYRSIDELAFEVQMKVMDDLFSFVNAYITGERAEAKIRSLFAAWHQFTQTNPNHLRFIGLFDHYYRNQYPTAELEEKYKAYIKHAFPTLVQLMMEGILDGSIRKDLDPVKTSGMMANTMMSLTQRMASRGNILRVEQEIDPDALMLQFIDMMIAYLKGEASAI